MAKIDLAELKAAAKYDVENAPVIMGKPRPILLPVRPQTILALIEAVEALEWVRQWEENAVGMINPTTSLRAVVTYGLAPFTEDNE